MHHCVINCKIPMDMPYHYARHAIRVILFPVLEEFGYVIPEEDLQQRLEKRYGECTKAMMISLVRVRMSCFTEVCTRCWVMINGFMRTR